MSLRRCFLGALAVLSASIVVLAMSGGVAAAAPDTKSLLEVDKIGRMSGTRVGAVAVGMTSDCKVLFTAKDALQFAFGQKTLLDFTLSQLRGQKSKNTALSEDQQVALVLRARRVIQLIVPAPARPASGSVKDTYIDADTLRFQVPS